MYRVDSIKLSIEKWIPWRETDEDDFDMLEEIKSSVKRILKPEIVLELLKDFTLYSTTKGGQKIKILCRY